MSQLAAEERRLAEERRAEHAERERVAGDALVEELTRSERRLEERLRAFSEDLERAQRHVESQLATLEQRYKQALAEVATRLESESAELGATADEQRRTVLRLREELERAAGQAVTEALDELEAQTVERRRSIEEITERLRAREAAVAESLEKAETDVRARLDVVLAEWERRQNERLERVTEREVERHTQLAMLAYDERLREAREDAAVRLRRELDRAVDLHRPRRADAAARRLTAPTFPGRDRQRQHETPTTMAEVTETPVWREDEQSKVESWRLHVLIEAGFPLPLAERLAGSEVDLHTCVELLARGCKPVVAAEILL